MANAAPQEKLFDAEGLRLPNGRKVVIELARGHGLFKLGFEDRQPFNFPDRFAGRYTKVDYALEDAALFVKEYWAAYREEENRKLADSLKEQIEVFKAEAEERRKKEEAVQVVAEAIQVKKRGRKPKTKPPVDALTSGIKEDFEKDIVGVS